MNATYRKNLKSIATACKNYTDEVADNLRWELGTYDLSIDTNTNTAHIKQLPSGTIQTTVAQVDGVGYKVNQLVKAINSTNWNTNDATATFSDGIATFTATAQNGYIRQNDTIKCETNHKYLVVGQVKLTTATTDVRITCLGGYTISTTATTNWQTLTSIFTTESSYTSILSIQDRRTSDWDTIQSKDVVIFDLTADFGSGNEPASVSDCASAYLQRGINIYEYTPQQSSIKNNAFTGVTVEGANLFDYEAFTSLKPNYYIEVVGGKTLYRNAQVAIISNWLVYDKDKNLIENMPSSFIASGSYTLPINARYISPRNDNSTSQLCMGYSEACRTYTPYIAPTTIPVDLTIIKDSNNVSLFPSGKLMGNSNVADFITPYNQESRWNEGKLKDYDWERVEIATDVYAFSTTISDIVSGKSTNIVCGIYNTTDSSVSTWNAMQDKEIAHLAGTTLRIRDDSYTDATTFKNHFTNDDVVQYERATPLTSTTDLTTLTKINAESNGTIILNNTDNVDMPNTIKSLKEVAK